MVLISAIFLFFCQKASESVISIVKMMGVEVHISLSKVIRDI
jgi:hypothetical protein